MRVGEHQKHPRVVNQRAENRLDDRQQSQDRGVTGVRFTVSNYVWGLHTMEFYCDGTAIRKLSADVRPTPPTLVIGVK